MHNCSNQISKVLAWNCIDNSLGPKSVSGLLLVPHRTASISGYHGDYGACITNHFFLGKELGANAPWKLVRAVGFVNKSGRRIPRISIPGVVWSRGWLSGPQIRLRMRLHSEICFNDFKVLISYRLTRAHSSTYYSPLAARSMQSPRGDWERCSISNFAVPDIPTWFSQKGKVIKKQVVSCKVIDTNYTRLSSEIIHLRSIQPQPTILCRSMASIRL